MQYNAPRIIETPVPEGEIEIAPRTGNSAPKRIEAAKAVRSLREIVMEKTRFAEEVSVKSAALQAATAEAVGLQDKWESLIAERAGLLARINHAEELCSTWRSELADYEKYIEGNWHKPLADVLAIMARHTFMCDRFPKWIAPLKERLAGFDSEIEKFAGVHGLKVPGSK